jgi:hypothetical protein
MVNDVYCAVVLVNLVGEGRRRADIRKEATNDLNERRICCELNIDCGQNRVCAQIGSKVLQETQNSVDAVTYCPNILGEKIIFTSNLTYLRNFSKYATYLIFV